MGIGLALSEELVIFAGRIAAPNLHDYGLPTAVDVPRIVVNLVETIEDERIRIRGDRKDLPEVPPLP